MWIAQIDAVSRSPQHTIVVTEREYPSVEPRWRRAPYVINDVSARADYICMRSQKPTYPFEIVGVEFDVIVQKCDKLSLSRRQTDITLAGQSGVGLDRLEIESARWRRTLPRINDHHSIGRFCLSFERA
jgi:hypothetical protein